MPSWLSRRRGDDRDDAAIDEPGPDRVSDLAGVAKHRFIDDHSPHDRTPFSTCILFCFLTIPPAPVSLAEAKVTRGCDVRLKVPG